jgi:hypothetical protein
MNNEELQKQIDEIKRSLETHKHDGLTSANLSLGGYVSLTGNETVAGVKTFSSFPITPSSSPTTDYQVSNKYYSDLVKNTVASDNLKTSADTERSVTETSYTKKKEIEMNTFGTIRVSHSAISTNPSYSCSTLVYINGVATGASRTTTGTTYETYTEDFTVKKGDLVQLYCATAAGNTTAKIKNFRLYYDLTNLSLSTVITD